MNTGKEIITKFHSIGDAELSLADTQWLIQNIDKAINSTKQAGQVEPEVMLLPKYRKYFESAENFIKYLIKNRKRIPDKYFVPYECDQTDLCWELAKIEEQKA